MEHERQVVGNKHNQHKSEEQSRTHGKEPPVVLGSETIAFDQQGEGEGGGVGELAGSAAGLIEKAEEKAEGAIRGVGEGIGALYSGVAGGLNLLSSLQDDNAAGLNWNSGELSAGPFSEHLEQVSGVRPSAAERPSWSSRGCSGMNEILDFENFGGRR